MSIKSSSANVSHQVQDPSASCCPPLDLQPPSPPPPLPRGEMCRCCSQNWATSTHLRWGWGLKGFAIPVPAPSQTHPPTSPGDPHVAAFLSGPFLRGGGHVSQQRLSPAAETMGFVPAQKDSLFFRVDFSVCLSLPPSGVSFVLPVLLCIQSSPRVAVFGPDPDNAARCCLGNGPAC